MAARLPMAPSPEFMQDVWVRKVLSTTGHTLLVYDYFLTLKNEAEYIWNCPWTVVKVMFLINRYGNLIGQTFIRLEEAGLLSHGSQVVCCNFTHRRDVLEHASSANASYFLPHALCFCPQSRFT